MALLNSYMGKTFTGTHSPQPEDIRKIWKNSEWQNNLFAIVNLTTTNDTHQVIISNSEQCPSSNLSSNRYINPPIRNISHTINLIRILLARRKK
jgi:hypothetical protein